MTIALLPDLPVFILDENNSMVPSSLEALRGSKAMIIDFWHTKCTRCPAAMEKLNADAETANKDDVIYLSCALSQGEGNHEVACELVTDGSFESMTHVFMDMTVKEAAKAAFGFTAVPFYVIVNKNGHIIGSGQPPALDYKALIKEATVNTVSPLVDSVVQPVTVANTFSLDEDF